jgi:hypothetical protein
MKPNPKIIEIKDLKEQKIDDNDDDDNNNKKNYNTKKKKFYHNSSMSATSMHFNSQNDIQI